MSSWLQFLETRGARVAAGRVVDFGDVRKELAAARDATILADLSHFAPLSATGADAAQFLHAQLTNDVAGLPADSAQWNGWCTAKGRLVASFLVIRRPDRYLLLVSSDIAESVRKRLSMYVLRSKVTLVDGSAELVRIGLAGKKAASLIAHRFEAAPGPMQVLERDGIIATGLEFGRFVIIAPRDSAQVLWEELNASTTQTGADAWDWTSIRAGVPTIVAATQEAFVPQMANFDLINALSFHKGCYPGQEIVARTQYRGILKRRMALVHVDSAERPLPGDRVFGASFGEQAAGQIANAAPSPDGGYDALAVAQIESLERGDLRWKSLDGPPLAILSRPDASGPAL
jgi:folate-binding protein YgfZ